MRWFAGVPPLCYDRLRHKIQFLLGVTIYSVGQVGAYAYEGPIHQQLSFIAARHYNNCVERDEVRLSALQARYMAKAVVFGVDSSVGTSITGTIKSLAV